MIRKIAITNGIQAADEIDSIKVDLTNTQTHPNRSENTQESNNFSEDEVVEE